MSAGLSDNLFCAPFLPANHWSLVNAGSHHTLVSGKRSSWKYSICLHKKQIILYQYQYVKRINLLNWNKPSLEEPGMRGVLWTFCSVWQPWQILLLWHCIQSLVESPPPAKNWALTELTIYFTLLTIFACMSLLKIMTNKIYLANSGMS